jgi:hypothetical protein
MSHFLHCLTSDFYIAKFFPRYNIDTVRIQYRNKAQNPNALFKALDMMKEEYYNMLKAKKAKSKAEAKEIAA